MTQNIPSLEEFLAAPTEQVAQVAPTSMIYWVGGSRRSAALAGIATGGQEYAKWSLEHLIRSVNLIFDHGVQDLIMPMLSPNNFGEKTPDYEEHLWYWLTQVLAGPKAIARYRDFGWRMRFIYEEHLPEIQETNARLRADQMPPGTPTFWAIVVPKANLSLRWMLDKLSEAKTKIKTTEEAIRFLYGEDITPATLCLGFGKIVVSPYALPPFLLGVLNCYWSQRPGWDGLTQDLLRTVFYDYAYLRSTWRQDKTGRAEQSLRHRAAWEEGPVIGVGMHLGPFWYPVSTPDPTLENASPPSQNDSDPQSQG